jgi:hypothetical protein
MQVKESKTNSHFWLSMVKSGIRMLGAVAIMFQDFELGGLLILLAEIVGIAEEL